MDYFRRVGAKYIDVGGYHCSCCGPRPKDRKKFRRLIRRVDKMQVKLLIK